MGKKSSNTIPVLFLNYSMDVGGIETLICEFASRLNSKGFLPYVCVFSGGGSLEENLQSEGVKVFCIKKKEGIDFTVIPKLRSYLKGKSIKILHTNNYTPWLYGALASMGIRGLKHIHTEHSNIEKKRRGWAERLLIYFTDSIVCVSDDVKQSMIQYQSISPKRLTVVHNGVDTDKFCPDQVKREHYRDELGIKHNTLVIGIVARLAPVKDHKTLINAFYKIYEKIPEAVLLIVGDGESKHMLIEQTCDMGLDKVVLFVGEKHDISGFLNTMDIFVLSSTSEGHNVSLLEAMSTTLPVVATDVGGNSEIVIDGVTGLLVPPVRPDILSDKILILLRNSNLRSQMGNNGRVRITKYFDMNRMIATYQEIYLSTLNS